MKLITLNTWGGRALHPLLGFLKKYASETDVFCLQEVYDADQKEIDRRHPDEHVRGDLFAKIADTLKDFTGFFAMFEDHPPRASSAIFVRKSIPIQEVGDFVVHVPKHPQEYGSRVFSARKAQYVKIDTGLNMHVILNIYGLWNAGPKTDTEDRIAQSERIRSFLQKTPGPKILCGDFNLLPETQSLKILEEGMRNLVRESGVQSTRTALYRHYDNPEEPNFADYILVTPDIAVHRFEVLPDLASDHSPLRLDYSL